MVSKSPKPSPREYRKPLMQTITKYVRFQSGSTTAYGILEDDTIREITGDLLGARKPAAAAHKLGDVKLLYPITPPKVLAVGLNYKSHLGERPAPATPEIFYKPVTCLQNPGDPIVIPADSKNTHYEGELVLIMGKRASRISIEDAPSAIFGVTCGNDVSERDWQSGPKKDLQ